MDSEATYHDCEHDQASHDDDRCTVEGCPCVNDRITAEWPRKETRRRCALGPSITAR